MSIIPTQTINIEYLNNKQRITRMQPTNNRRNVEWNNFNNRMSSELSIINWSRNNQCQNRTVRIIIRIMETIKLNINNNAHQKKNKYWNKQYWITKQTMNRNGINAPDNNRIGMFTSKNGINGNGTTNGITKTGTGNRINGNVVVKLG